ncbi:MAG: SpoVR family protein [Armatimonadetes bacterium]|nr:SpoVR family protein [Armatimonadota bacterium]MDE2205379.1 SpoVR family protein [Armatimonadota bacterium]
MNASERADLERWIDLIQEAAHQSGLDFYPTHFEVAPDHVIYELGSYGLPARFSHWTFGRDYHHQKTLYEYGLARIYEIVFNTDPCQAFLLDSNSMLAHKFVVAHVLGHNDFFKNNTYFERTNRQMVEQVRVHGNRIRKYEETIGTDTVELFLDGALALADNFDPGLTAEFRPPVEPDEGSGKAPSSLSGTEYDDLWNIRVEKRPAGDASPAAPEPTRDLLGFLRDRAPSLARWQRDILDIVRDETLYFIPQMRTKILNEGWASFWHERILTSLPLTPEEHLEFRRLHASVISPGSRMTINPYYVGYTILRDIERRWNGETSDEAPEENWRGEPIQRAAGGGMEKLFEVRSMECDVTFLRKYLTRALVERLDLYTYRRDDSGGEARWVVQDAGWEKVRDTLVDSMTNFGLPIITVEDDDYMHRGELLLRHAWDGKDLDVDYTSRTLAYLARIWRKPVHLATNQSGQNVVLCHDGDTAASHAP